MIKKIHKDLVWKYFIKRELDKILLQDSKPKTIVLTISNKIEFIDIDDLKDAILDPNNNYDECEICSIDIREASDWNREIDKNRIIFNQNPSNLEGYKTQYYRNFEKLSISPTTPLHGKEIFFLLQQIFGEQEKELFHNVRWDKFRNKIKLNNLPAIISRIPEALRLIDIEINMFHPITYSLSPFSVETILDYAVNGDFCEIDIDFLKYFEEFFNFDININQDILKDNILHFLKGFICKIPEIKILDGKIISYYLGKYKLANVDFFPNLQILKDYTVWSIQPTFLWFYFKEQLLMGNSNWISEIFRISFFKFNEKKIIVKDHVDNNFDRKFESFFWIKLFLHARGFRTLNIDKNLPSQIITLLRPKFRILLDQQVLSNYDAYYKIPYISNDQITKLIKQLSYETSIMEDNIQKLPKNIYKPAFSERSLDINFFDINLIKEFPELFLFSIALPQTDRQVEKFIEKTIWDESTNLDVLIKYLLIFRYYELLLVNEEINPDDFTFPIEFLISQLKNIISYRIWTIIKNDYAILNNYFKINLENWVFDYNLIKNSSEYFVCIRQIMDYLGDTNVESFYLELFKKLSVPSKVFTEYLLYETNFFDYRSNFISNLNNKNVLLIIIDGLSYILANKLDFNESNHSIIPVKIKGISDTKDQLQRIWRNLNKKPKNFSIGCDTKISNEVLFNFVEDLNDFVKLNGYTQLFQDENKQFFQTIDNTKFYIVYVSYFESLNSRISDESLLISKYNQILELILKNVNEIFKTHESTEVFITGDHGSILVNNNQEYKELFENLSGKLTEINLTRNGTTRGFYINDIEIGEETLKILSELNLILIKNKSETDPVPYFSLLPGLIFGESAKYDHDGVSLDENIVPWIEIKKESKE